MAIAAEHPAGVVRRLATGFPWARAGGVVLGWVAFLGIWAIFSAYVFGSFRLPAPWTVAAQMWDVVRGDQFLAHFRSSVFKVFAGFAVAVAIGVPVGFLMGRTRYWRAFFHDPVMVAGSIPGITYAVMALVIFGVSVYGPILAVGLVSMPYVAVNVAEGLQGVDRKLIDMSRAYGRSERQILRHVLLPSLAPFIFAGVRLSFALAWKVEQLTEVFGSSGGIGFKIHEEFERFSITGVLTWVFVFIGFMLILERLVLVRLERHLFRWRPGEQRR